jgi:hypothetical protein
MTDRVESTINFRQLASDASITFSIRADFSPSSPLTTSLTSSVVQSGVRHVLITQARRISFVMDPVVV